jgi:hypothetical protein
VEIAEDRVHVDDLLARELQDQPQDAVGGRVVRADVEEHLPVAEGVELALALGPGGVGRDRLVQVRADLAVEHDARVVFGALLLRRARLHRAGGPGACGAGRRAGRAGRHLCPQLAGARRMPAAGSSATTAGP